MAFFDFLDTCIEIPLDDPLVFSKIVEEHKKGVDTLLAFLAKH